MAVQPKHWLITGRHVGLEGQLIANEGYATCVVIADSEHEALEQGAMMLNQPAAFLSARRFTSGAPVYDPRDNG